MSDQEQESDVSPWNSVHPDRSDPNLGQLQGPGGIAAGLLCGHTCCEAVWDAVRDVIYAVAPDGTICALNPAFEAITGLSASAFIGRPMEALVHPEDAAAARHLFMQVLAGETVPVHELRVRTANGEFLVGELNAARLQVGDEVRVLGIARDVTQQRQTESLLREQLDFERAVAAISQCFLHTDRGGTASCLRASLRQIGELFGADWAGFGSLSAESQQFERVQHWLRDASQTQRVEQEARAARLPNLISRLAAERELIFRGPDAEPGWAEERTLLRNLGFGAGAVIPVSVGQKSLYWIGVLSTMPRQWPAEVVSRLRCLGQLLSSAVARDQAEQRLHHEQWLLMKLLDLQDRDQQLIAHEVHDGFLQYALATHMHLQALTRKLAGAQDGAHQTLDKAAQMLQRALAEGRRLLSGFRSVVLNSRGLVPAVEELVDEFKIHGGLYIALTSEVHFARLDPRLENSIFRIVQEALNNVKRHSQTSHAAVRLLQTDDWLRIEIRDCGVGFDPNQVDTSCFGLRGILERARLFGGRGTINSAPGKGTKIVVLLPLSLETGRPEAAG